MSKRGREGQSHPLKHSVRAEQARLVPRGAYDPPESPLGDPGPTWAAECEEDCDCWAAMEWWDEVNARILADFDADFRELAT